MVRQCGLNRLLQYASWLSALISVARQNKEVLEAMQSLRQVVYTGVSMNPEDEAWALANGIPITVRAEPLIEPYLLTPNPEPLRNNRDRYVLNMSTYTPARESTHIAVHSTVHDLRPRRARGSPASHPGARPAPRARATRRRRPDPAVRPLSPAVRSELPTSCRAQPPRWPCHW